MGRWFIGTFIPSQTVLSAHPRKKYAPDARTGMTSRALFMAPALQKHRRTVTWICILISVVICLVCSGCSVDASPGSSKKKTSGKRDSTPQVLVPEASGTAVYQSDAAAIDASNSSEGYIMASYSGTNPKVKFRITTPDGIKYTYLMSGSGAYEAFPLTGGSGSYQTTVFENVSGDEYAAVLTQTLEVTVTDEFKPYLYPNQYVTFTPDSKAVKKGASLVKSADTDLDAVKDIYDYVIKNVAYDKKLAENVSYGYLPDVDKTLKEKTGICFDYAALMTAMLRSQRIPTRLEVGYSGDVYHAWISSYIAEIGWIDNVIEFNGKTWTLMDPTLAANNKAKNVKKYISDGSHYTIKYTY